MNQAKFKTGDTVRCESLLFIGQKKGDIGFIIDTINRRMHGMCYIIQETQIAIGVTNDGVSIIRQIRRYKRKGCSKVKIVGLNITIDTHFDNSLDWMIEYDDSIYRRRLIIERVAKRSLHKSINK